MRSAYLASVTLLMLAACGQTTEVEQHPSEGSEVRTTPMEAPAPTTVSITEADARSRIEAQGYTNVTGLTQNPDGSWSATGTREGEQTTVTVTDTGVSVGTAGDVRTYP